MRTLYESIFDDDSIVQDAENAKILEWQKKCNVVVNGLDTGYKKYGMGTNRCDYVNGKCINLFWTNARENPGLTLDELLDPDIIDKESISVLTIYERDNPELIKGLKKLKGYNINQLSLNLVSKPNIDWKKELSGVNINHFILKYKAGLPNNIKQLIIPDCRFISFESACPTQWIQKGHRSPLDYISGLKCEVFKYTCIDYNVFDSAPRFKIDKETGQLIIKDFMKRNPDIKKFKVFGNQTLWRLEPTKTGYTLKKDI